MGKLWKLVRNIIDIVCTLFAIVMIVGLFVSPIVLFFMAETGVEKYLATALGIFLYGGAIFYVSKNETLAIKDGYLEYTARIDSYFQRYVTHSGKSIAKKLKIEEVNDIAVNLHFTRNKNGETLYYTIAVCTPEDSFQYTGYENWGYEEIWKVFELVYPRVAVNFKRDLINYICQSTVANKKTDKFPLSIYDDCLKLRLIRNPYDPGSKDRLLTCGWQDLRLEMDEQNMTCLFYIDEFDDPIYRLGIKDRKLVWNRFDHYVLWDIVQDMHREKVERLSELSYMQESEATPGFNWL